MKTTNTVLTIIIVLLVLVGGYFLFTGDSQTVNPDTDTDVTDESTTTPAGTEVPTSTDATSSDDTTGDGAMDAGQPADGSQTTIGTSADGRDITAYHFGSGDTHVLLVGGIHGGYSYNTSLLSYDLVDYFEDNPDAVGENQRVTVIPNLNPDGLAEVTDSSGDFSAADVDSSEDAQVAGRFNGNDVDLNRNFDCSWQSTGTWQSREVDGGTSAFSEPEAQAIRDYVAANEVSAAVVYYSQAGAVYTSSCEGAVSSETNELADTYASASGYPNEGEFTAYEISGDMVNWMASEDIPAISVLLSNHQDAEYDMNRDGVEAVLESYAN